ncbi:hypothetical protein HYU09_01485 [Candidatus Woesearchaeota archaeon]|nr:hypothetical protein [Candidatus Woesearchaeota archaeon]
MKCVALTTQTKVGYGETAPFDGVTRYILVGLYDITQESPTVARMRKNQAENAAGKVSERAFVRIGAVDEIAMALAKENGGIFRGAAVFGRVGYVAFRPEDEAKVRQIVDYL